MGSRHSAEATAGVRPRILDWYGDNARDLPWRRPARTPWGVLVSEVMLQQTPVARVEPAWRAWMDRWPTPAGLAAAPLAEAIRAWHPLGYPRRAQRLHAAAGVIVHRHDGRVPGSVTELRALPGVGEYTAAAVHAFAFDGRAAVLDTNVRRVLSRWLDGDAFPTSASVTVSERRRAEDLLPGDGTAPLWSVAVMELGALVCSARRPRCGSCPIADGCAWRAAGSPPGAGPQRQAPYEGSDRQARGFILRMVSQCPAPRGDVIDAWVRHRPGAQSAAQAERALAGLAGDGLIVVASGTVRLP